MHALAILCACGMPGTATIDKHSPNEVQEAPSPFSGHDPPNGTLASNFPSFGDVIDWACFEMLVPVSTGTEPVGRCYRMMPTCEVSRKHWRLYYQVESCGRGHEHAACLRGRNKATGDYVAACFLELDHCLRAYTEMVAEQSWVEFVSECVVLD